MKKWIKEEKKEDILISFYFVLPFLVNTLWNYLVHQFSPFFLCCCYVFIILFSLPSLFIFLFTFYLFQCFLKFHVFGLLTIMLFFFFFFFDGCFFLNRHIKTFFFSFPRFFFYKRDLVWYIMAHKVNTSILLIESD